MSLGQAWDMSGLSVPIQTGKEHLQFHKQFGLPDM